MRRLIRQLFYRNVELVEYLPFHVTGFPREKVFLENGENKVDISDNQWPVCLEPLTIAVWLDHGQSARFLRSKKLSILFQDGKTGRPLARLDTRLFETLYEKEGVLFILRIDGCQLYQVSRFESFILYRSFFRKPGSGFRKFCGLSAVFSYPRKVQIVSFRNAESYNMFPMDLTGQPRGTNYFLFGLRHSNLSLPLIASEKKLLVADAPFEKKDPIYQLGQHHSSRPPALDTLSFATSFSKNFGFPMPEWTDNYSEITLTETRDLGSHMLLWGFSDNQATKPSSTGSLHHIHFLHSLYRQRQERKQGKT